LEALKAAWGDFGSGYPSDPATKAWLAAHAKTGKPWPDFVRTRWETITAFGQTSML
jgi:ribonuclease HII